jgi:nicotinamidase-related amidase
MPLLKLQSQTLGQDTNGHNQWHQHSTTQDWPPSQTALLLCDIWDQHWSRGANDRVAGMIQRMVAVVDQARRQGMLIVHAPSDTMDFYQDHPARQRITHTPPIEPPADLKHPDPPLPIDHSDDGSDTDGDQPHKAWKSQHAAISIDAERDIISDDGRQIYSFLQSRGIDRLLIMGVHTNMCVLNRSFAIKQMVRWGLDVTLIRDLTDTMYNPAMSPYVNHEEGTRLVIEYIEKFWCPTVLSRDILSA